MFRFSSSMARSRASSISFSFESVAAYQIYLLAFFRFLPRGRFSLAFTLLGNLAGAFDFLDHASLLVQYSMSSLAGRHDIAVLHLAVLIDPTISSRLRRGASKQACG